MCIVCWLVEFDPPSQQQGVLRTILDTSSGKVPQLAACRTELLCLQVSRASFLFLLAFGPLGGLGHAFVLLSDATTCILTKCNFLSGMGLFGDHIHDCFECLILQMSEGCKE